MPNTDGLWGGQLSALVLDPVEHRCEMLVTVNNGGLDTTYQLVFDEISEFRFYSDILLPWAYAEVTEIHTSQDDGSDQWVTEIMLWSEAAGLVVRSKSLELHSLDQDSAARRAGIPSPSVD